MTDVLNEPAIEPSEEERAAALAEEQRVANEAAAAHRGSVPAKAMRAELRGSLETRISTGPKFELREVPNGTGGTNLRFTGFACVTGDDATYEMEDWLGPWLESVSVGSFTKTLAEGCDTAFLVNHTGITLARTKPGTMRLSEEIDANQSVIPGVTGLHTEALLDPKNMYVQAIQSAVERGDLDEMSFAFRVTRDKWDERTWDRRWIQDVSLHKGDTSLVNYGASHHTGGTVAMRQLLRTRSEMAAPDATFRRLMVKLCEVRAGAALDMEAMAELQTILDAIDAGDTNLDQALIDLSAFMGVVNPDIAQDAALDRDEEGDDEVDEGAARSALIVPDFRADRARLESLRHAPRSA